MDNINIVIALYNINYLITKLIHDLTVLLLSCSFFNMDFYCIKNIISENCFEITDPASYPADPICLLLGLRDGEPLMLPCASLCSPTRDGFGVTDVPLPCAGVFWRATAVSTLSLKSPGGSLSPTCGVNDAMMSLGENSRVMSTKSRGFLYRPQVD
jgi:hypothetical protein